jgi:crossover junction endodeoxyribonuclease RuvC
LRLKPIYDELGGIIGTHVPVEATLERMLMAKNADSTLKIEQAHGASLGCGLAIHEYTPNVIKQALVGKEQVQHMIGGLLNVRRPLQADALSGVSTSGFARLV